MKIIGYVRSDFVSKKDGKKVEGYATFISEPIPAEADGGGVRVEEVYLSLAKLDSLSMDLPSLLGHEVSLLYNKYGTVARIEVSK